MKKMLQNMTIITSASKIVFILMAVASCVAFFIGKLDQNNFMILAGSAFAFYFSNKPTNAAGEITK